MLNCRKNLQEQKAKVEAKKIRKLRSLSLLLNSRTNRERVPCPCGYCGYVFGDELDPLLEDEWLGCKQWVHESCGKKTEGVLFAIVARLTTVAKTLQKAKEIRTRNFKNFVSSCRETIEFLNF